MGIKLLLDSSIQYENSQLNEGWLNSSVIVTYLEIDIRLVDCILPRSFFTLSFQRLKSMVLTNVRGNHQFYVGILMGLESTLENLAIYDANEDGVFNIDALTEDMNALTSAYFKINLNDTITSKTFSRAPNLMDLDLSYCKIKVIGLHAFDSLLALLRLNLSGNFLQRLPSKIFNVILPSYILFIQLSDNPWHCDTEICDLQSELIDSFHNLDQLICSSPSNFEGTPVEYLNVCLPEYMPTESTSTNTIGQAVNTSITPSSSFICTTDGSSYTHQLSVEPPRSDFYVNRYGDVTTQHSSNDFVLIWFPANKTIPNSQCLVSQNYTNFKIDIEENVSYTFCSMNRSLDTISPLDCLTYIYIDINRHAWLLLDDRGILISISVLGLFLGTTIGAVFGYYLLREFGMCRKSDESNHKTNTEPMSHRTSCETIE